MGRLETEHHQPCIEAGRGDLTDAVRKGNWPGFAKSFWGGMRQERMAQRHGKRKGEVGLPGRVSLTRGHCQPLPFERREHGQSPCQTWKRSSPPRSSREPTRAISRESCGISGTHPHLESFPPPPGDRDGRRVARRASGIRCRRWREFRFRKRSFSWPNAHAEPRPGRSDG